MDLRFKVPILLAILIVYCTYWFSALLERIKCFWSCRKTPSMATCIAALLCTGAPWHRLCCGCFLPILQTAAAIYCRLSLLFLPAVSDFYSISCANNYGVYLLPLLPCTDAVLLSLLVWTAAMLLMSSSCMQHATAICWVLRLILQLLSSECAWATSAAQEPLSFFSKLAGLKLFEIDCCLVKVFCDNKV